MAGHRPHLLAPARSGRVLVGPPPGGVARLVDLDGPEVAAWLGGAPAGRELTAALGADAVLAATRSGDLLERLRDLAPRVLVRDPSPPPGVHASRWLAAPVRELDGDPDQDPPTLTFAREEREAAHELASRLAPGFLAVHPGSGSPAKNWSVHGYAALVRAHAGGRPWLLVSGPADGEPVAGLASVPGAVVARELPVRVLGALLARSGLYVGNDSGVTHLAAASGAPTLALFGPTDPVVWGPVGPLVETVSSADGTMEGLGSSAVQSAVERLLARAPSASVPPAEDDGPPPATAPRGWGC